jgi:hypothetical protein
MTDEQAEELIRQLRINNRLLYWIAQRQMGSGGYGDRTLEKLLESIE